MIYCEFLEFDINLYRFIISKLDDIDAVGSHGPGTPIYTVDV